MIRQTHGDGAAEPEESLAIEAQVPQDDSYQLTPRDVSGSYDISVLVMKRRCHRCWIWA